MPPPRIESAGLAEDLANEDRARTGTDAAGRDRAFAAELVAQLLQTGLQSIDLNQAVRGQLWRALTVLYVDEVGREGADPVLAAQRLLEDLPRNVTFVHRDATRRATRRPYPPFAGEVPSP